MHGVRPLLAGIIVAVVAALALPGAALAVAGQDPYPDNSLPGAIPADRVFTEADARAFTERFVDRNAARLIATNRRQVVEAQVTSPSCVRNLIAQPIQRFRSRTQHLCLYVANLVVSDLDAPTSWEPWADRSMERMPVEPLPDFDLFDDGGGNWWQNTERFYRCTGVAQVTQQSSFSSFRPLARILFNQCTRVPRTWDDLAPIVPVPPPAELE